MHPKVLTRVAILAILVAIATTEQCSYDPREGYIIDVHNSEKNGAIFMTDVNSLTEEDCRNACCHSEEETMEDGTKARCNLVVFHHKDKAQKSKNCFLVFCPREDSCRLSKVKGFSSSFMSRIPLPEPTEPEVEMDTTADYEVFIRKPPSLAFYHPDVLPVNLHKLFRRSNAEGEAAAVKDSLEQAETALQAAKKVLDHKAESATDQTEKQLAKQEGNLFSMLAENMLDKMKSAQPTTGKRGTFQATTQASSKDKEMTSEKGALITTSPRVRTKEKSQQAQQTTASTVKVTDDSVSQPTPAQSPQAKPGPVATVGKTTLESQTPKSPSSAQTTKQQAVTDQPVTSLQLSTLSTTSTNPGTSPLLAKSPPSGKETPPPILNSTPVGAPKPTVVLPHETSASSQSALSSSGPSASSKLSTAKHPTTPWNESPTRDVPLQTSSRTSSASFTSSVPASPSHNKTTQSSTLGHPQEQSHHATQPTLQSSQALAPQSVTVQSGTLGDLASASPPQPLSSILPSTPHDSPPHSVTAPPIPPPPSNQSVSTPSSAPSTVTNKSPTVPTTPHLVSSQSHSAPDTSPSTSQGIESTQSSTLLPDLELTSPASTTKEAAGPLLTSPPKSQSTPSVPSDNSESNQIPESTLDPLRRNFQMNETKTANGTAASVDSSSDGQDSANDTAASVDSSEDGQDSAQNDLIASNGALIAAVCFGVLFLLAVLVVLSKHWYEAYQRRHYSKVDYLINGMYN